MTKITLHAGDNRETLRRLIDQGVRVHSVCTDPPYGLVSVQKRFGKADCAPARIEGNDGSFARLSGGFMGKQWDGTEIERDPEFWKLVYEILLPGGACFAFGGSRTIHWQICAMEMAGFTIHPIHGWVFGTGFPKGHAISVEGFEGWSHGTQTQKPAIEPICLAQRPFSEKTGNKNVEKHGVGAFNIEACRVPDGNESKYPSNLILDGSDEVVSMFPEGKDGKSAARFFHHFPPDCNPIFYNGKAGKSDRGGSKHPTVKPIALMQYLIRHITPKGGVVLDPFAGSGTTAEAANLEGFDCILMEAEPEYVTFLNSRFEGRDNINFTTTDEGNDCGLNYDGMGDLDLGDLDLDLDDHIDLNLSEESVSTDGLLDDSVVLDDAGNLDRGTSSQNERTQSGHALSASPSGENEEEDFEIILD